MTSLEMPRWLASVTLMSSLVSTRMRGLSRWAGAGAPLSTQTPTQESTSVNQPCTQVEGVGNIAARIRDHRRPGLPGVQSQISERVDTDLRFALPQGISACKGLTRGRQVPLPSSCMQPVDRRAAAPKCRRRALSAAQRRTSARARRQHQRQEAPTCRADWLRVMP